MEPAEGNESDNAEKDNDHDNGSTTKAPLENESLFEQRDTDENSEPRKSHEVSSAKTRRKSKRVSSTPAYWYTDNDQLQYIKDCRASGTVPSRYFLRHLKDENLSLKHSVLGLRKLKPILASISNNLCITHLDLTNACINDECVNDLCHMFRENTCITDLNLSENQITSKSAEILCEVLASATQLLRLNLRKNLFSDTSGIFFSELIATSLNLVYMNISYNDLGEMSCYYIGRALPQATTLIEFDLSWNRLKGRKLDFIGKGLAENKNLKYLNLSANGIGPRVGCRELAYALRNNQTLKTLDLSDNRITAEGSVLLSKGFYVNSTLTCLKMARNPMQTAGCFAILTGILRNPNCGLLELDLQDIVVNQDFLDLQDSARIKLPNLCVRYGQTSNDKIRALSPRFKRPEQSPKEILITMGRCTKQSLADLLRPLDTVGDKIVTRQAFVKILNMYMAKLGIQFTEEQMKQLMLELDPNNQQEIGFADFEI